MDNSNPNMPGTHQAFKAHITTVLGALLGAPHFDPHTSFFLLGADELILFRLLNKLNQLYPNVQLSWRDINEHSTMAALAHCMTQRDKTIQAANIKEQFLGAQPAERIRIMENHLCDAISHALNSSVTLTSDRLGSGFHHHHVYMELTWVFKRDFQCPIYKTEIEQFENISQLATYFTNELEIRWGLRSPEAKWRAAMHGSLAKSEEVSWDLEPPSSKRVQNVVLLLSAPRSGSTLLRLMLSRHSQLFCPPELNLLHHKELSSWVGNRLNRFPRDSGVIQNLMGLIGFRAAECEEILDAPASHTMSISKVYQRIIAESGQATLVDKTPSYAKRIDTLRRAESLFEKPRYIHLIRHPCAAIESFVRHRFEKLIGKPGEDPFLCAEKTWLIRNQNILNIANHVEQNRYHQIRYEDLVQNPHQVMESLCVFLGVPFEEAVLHPYDRPNLIGGPGDYDIFQHDKIEPQLADNWQQSRQTATLCAETLELAKLFGYCI